MRLLRLTPFPRKEALQGTLPIVTDQFATVTVMPSAEIQRSTGGTLGDVLQSKHASSLRASIAPGCRAMRSASGRISTTTSIG